MGVPIQKENEAPFGPETRREENGVAVSPRHPIKDSESALRILPAGSGRKWFYCNLISALYAEKIMKAAKELDGIRVGGVNINNLRYADDTIHLSLILKQNSKIC